MNMIVKMVGAVRIELTLLSRGFMRTGPTHLASPPLHYIYTVFFLIIQLYRGDFCHPYTSKFLLSSVSNAQC